jgi:hypothetical protein
MSQSLFAATYRVSHTLNNDFWLFSTSSSTHSLESDTDDGEKFDGTSFQLSLGRGIVRDNWSFSTSIDIISGPFDPFFNGELEVEFNGLGLTLISNYAVSESTLRGFFPSISLAGGMNFGTINGSSIGRNTNLDPDFDSSTNSGKINSYSLSMTTLNLIFGTTLNWIEKARPQGNHPDLLKTRIEGYSLGILAQLPVYANYSSSKSTLIYSSSTEKVSSQFSDSSGTMEGWSLVIALSAFISG